MRSLLGMAPSDEDYGKCVTFSLLHCRGRSCNDLKRLLVGSAGQTYE
jgi:hypothetical protein